MLQQLDAVLAAWSGDAGPLARLLPERPTFPTDLTPPGIRDGDPPGLRALLAALARGDWHAVLAVPAGGGPRADAARAIAHERAGQPAAAIAAWDRVLAAGEDARARLARGSLLARAGRRAEAAIDLVHAGGSFPALWNRAALLVLTALDERGGMDTGLLARARLEAGEPSDYWSDPTVGRLLFSTAVARILAADAAAPRRASDPERKFLRAAEEQLEFDTFWDRALLLVGWVRVGAPEEAARVAAPLARSEADEVGRQPALGDPTVDPERAFAGKPLFDLVVSLAHARRLIDAGDAAAARQAIARQLSREDLRRFRIPCARCRQGSIGVEEVREAFPDRG